MKHKKTTRAHPLADTLIGCGAAAFVLGNLLDDAKRGADLLVWVDAVFLVALIPWLVNALRYLMHGGHDEPPGGRPDTEAWKALTVLRMPATKPAPNRLTDQEVADFAALIQNEKPVPYHPVDYTPPVLPLGPERAAAVSEQILELHRTRPEDVYSFLEGETSEQYWTRLCGCEGKNPGAIGHLLMCELSAR